LVQGESTKPGALMVDVDTERAVALALSKYCSVAATLAPAVVVETSVVVNGTPGELVRQPGADWSVSPEAERDV